MRRIVVSFLLLIISSFMQIALGDNSTQPPALVVVETAMERTLVPRSWYSGTVISRNDAKIPSEIEGRLIQVAEVGQIVALGDQIAQLDNTVMQQELLEQKAAARRAEASLHFYNKEVTRLRRLANNNNAAQSQLDQAISDQSATRSDLDAARAKVQQAKIRLNKTIIRSPFSGVIAERYLQPGEWAENGNAVVRLVDNQSLEVQARVPTENLPYLATDMSLILESKGETIEGKVRTIVPVGDEVSRLNEIRVAIQGNKWPVGKSVRVAVPTDVTRTVLSVSRDALVLRRDGIYVFRVAQDNTAERVEVRTGTASKQYIEVSGGIKPNDRVIIRGAERLRPGQKVTIGSIGKK